MKRTTSRSELALEANHIIISYKDITTAKNSTQPFFFLFGFICSKYSLAHTSTTINCNSFQPLLPSGEINFLYIIYSSLFWQVDSTTNRGVNMRLPYTLHTNAVFWSNSRRCFKPIRQLFFFCQSICFHISINNWSIDFIIFIMPMQRLCFSRI